MQKYTRKANYKRREAIAQFLIQHPSISYSEVADMFGVSSSTVQRTARAYDIQRREFA